MLQKLSNEIRECYEYAVEARRKAARPSLDYDGRYGVESGARFVEAVYKILSEKK